MAQLPNVKQELFATYLVEGRGVAESYLAAGYAKHKGSATKATELKAQPHIQARIAELMEDRTRFKEQFIIPRDPSTGQEEPVTIQVLSRVWVLEQLMKNAQDSAAALQFSASNQALIAIGKEIGMFNPKPPDDDDKKRPEDAQASPEAIANFLDKLGVSIDTTKVGVKVDNAGAAIKEPQSNPRIGKFTDAD